MLKAFFLLKTARFWSTIGARFQRLFFERKEKLMKVSFLGLGYLVDTPTPQM